MPPSASDILPGGQNGEMAENARQATALLKALAHEGRLMILCHLSSGAKTVTELERLLGQNQPAVSQQLARLREDGIIEARRDGRAIYYAVSDGRARAVVELLYELFCAAAEKAD